MTAEQPASSPCLCTTTWSAVARFRPSPAPCRCAGAPRRVRQRRQPAARSRYGPGAGVRGPGGARLRTGRLARQLVVETWSSPLSAEWLDSPWPRSACASCRDLDAMRCRGWIPLASTRSSSCLRSWSRSQRPYLRRHAGAPSGKKRSESRPHAAVAVGNWLPQTGTLRNGLAAAQLALALALLAGAGILSVSFYNLMKVNLGFRMDRVLTFDVNLPDIRYDAARRARFQEDLAQALTAIPGVTAAGGTSRLPSTGSFHPWPFSSRPALSPARECHSPTRTSHGQR